ncbi:zinc finger protein 547 [Cynocephalus volans]|uniref:zinc finger protein 547 n=1 Tax=Cynocephalus volans TaxID=110931 RepID=UPI002FCBFE2E
MGILSEEAKGLHIGDLLPLFEALAVVKKVTKEGHVYFKDLALYFFQEEWELLDESLRHLYHEVMLENFAFLSSVGCWHGAEDDGVPSEQGVSVGVSQVLTPTPGSSTQKTQSCETCSSLLKGILCLVERDGTHLEHGLYRYPVKLHQHQKQQFQEKLSRGVEGRPSFVKNHSGHMAERTFCSESGKAFSHKHLFVDHEKIHPGERTYECSHCGKFFRCKSKLIRHHRVHMGEQPYKCSECGNAFCTKFNLICHQKVHTGERPYECSECGKAFCRKFNLICHQKIHTGDRSYECSKCKEIVYM